MAQETESTKVTIDFGCISPDVLAWARREAMMDERTVSAWLRRLIVKAYEGREKK